ncbi:hypothetical protein GCM10010402_81750 [Actinomadura luteofluorescens]
MLWADGVPSPGTVRGLPRVRHRGCALSAMHAAGVRPVDGVGLVCFETVRRLRAPRDGTWGVPPWGERRVARAAVTRVLDAPRGAGAPGGRRGATASGGRREW